MTINEHPPPVPGPIQRAPRKTRKRYPNRAVRDRDRNPSVRLQESPEGRALWKLWTSKAVDSKRGRQLGHIDGFSLKELRKLRSRAGTEAKAIVARMVEQQMIPKGVYAAEALETVIAVLRSPIPSRDKLTAARMLLDWTMAKPAGTEALTIQTAEDLLDAVASSIASERP